MKKEIGNYKKSTKPILEQKITTERKNSTETFHSKVYEYQAK